MDHTSSISLNEASGATGRLHSGQQTSNRTFQQLETCYDRDFGSPAVYNSPPYDLNLNTNRSSVLDELRERVKRQKNELEAYLRKLEKSSQCDLVRALVDEQMSLSLKEREQNYQTQECNLAFTKTVKLTTSDLYTLLDKHQIPLGFAVEKAEISLNLIMKDS